MLMQRFAAMLCAFVVVSAGCVSDQKDSSKDSGEREERAAERIRQTRSPQRCRRIRYHRDGSEVQRFQGGRWCMKPREAIWCWFITLAR